MKKRSTFLAIVATLLIVGAFAAAGLALVRRASSPMPRLMVGRDKVGVVPIEGIIGLDVESDKIIEQLEAFKDNPSVKAVVVRISSPGGSVGPSQEIYDKILEVSEEKHVVASLADVAASGGYYVAAAADKIVANPGTITGSIGVIAEFPNFAQLLDKIGVKQAVVKSGEFKDIGSPVRDLTEKEKQLMQGLIDNVYDQFVMAIVEGREMERDAILPYADGRVFSGEQALAYGFVDDLGGLEAAVKMAGELGGIEGEPAVLYPERRFDSFVDMFFGQQVDGLLKRAQLPSFHLSYLFVPPTH
ncbi:MAG: signal peptide peptidase SppA [Deltaproteobacteria bacterium]|nr:signal peptide peptidase SppA [Deltaproteobacteria bacterium]